MDIHSLINNPPSQDATNSRPAAPVTPIQAHPQQGFREYSHSQQRPQASPGKHPSQDYGAQPGPYASPSAYPGNYQVRPPPPPPIQAPPPNDLRSPARSFSAQSPYQHTPSSSNSQYPYPQPHQTPQSPAHHQPYPPSHPQRDSYPQANPPPSHIQHSNSYNQISPVPQTPPIGIPGAPHPILQHSGSQSSLSNTTPTSGHSQHQYFSSQYSQDSPIGGSHNIPQQIAQRQQSQQSQPGTPLGPPPTQRQSSGAFQQPTSPYQQRRLSSGPFQHYQQSSPAPPAPPSIPRQPSTPSAYDSRRTSSSEQQRRSQSEREQSLSVSPKTRLPSQPRGEVATPQSDSSYMSSSKRKMDERELPVEPPRRIQQPEQKVLVNGNSRAPSSSPQQPPRKKTRYKEKPIWAQSIKSKEGRSLINSTLSKANGKQPAAVGSQPQMAPSPMLIKVETNGNRQASPSGAAPASPLIAEENAAAVHLGPWEPSITGYLPPDQIAKAVADFLFNKVVQRTDLGELSSRGVEIEIEAKLGQLTDKDTNMRVSLPVATECVLQSRDRIGFRSEMTEAQHKHLNAFLNTQVQESHPNYPHARKKRVQVEYRHRRETDKFYELPAALYSTVIPNAIHAIRARSHSRHAVKVRVSYDQKTQEVIAKIIKVRVDDLDIYMPLAPLDCRISINFEMRYDGDIEDLVPGGATGSPDRMKDRLSYTQSHYQIDLTQVTQTFPTGTGTQTQKEHELEIEVSSDAIRDQGQRALAGQPNSYLSLVEGLINNVRILAKEIH